MVLDLTWSRELYDQIESTAAGAHRARGRQITVHRPWAWMWWSGHPLVTEDPDVVDEQDPRTISTTEVEWLLVFHAVRHAVGSLPDPAARVGARDVRGRGPVPAQRH